MTMTTPGKGDPVGGRALERTRKQLKDMDRLLEEMLALPIGERPRRNVAERETPAGSEPMAPALTVLAPVPEHAADTDRMVSFLAMPERTDAGTVATPPDQQPHLELDSIAEPPAAVDAVQILTMERQAIPEPDSLSPSQPQAELTPRELMKLVGVTEQQVQEIAVRTAPRGPLYWVLIGINGLYDRLADLFWPLGGLLKWIGTRYLLGLVGILLLLGSLAWFCISRFGWTW
jgi:hypothetical protein